MTDVPSGSLRAPRQRQSTVFDVCLAAARDLAWLIAAISDELRIRRDMRQLTAMDDHMLKDIGLGRSEIEYRVRHGRDGRYDSTGLAIPRIQHAATLLRRDK
jgi:uncharacterized protein YjiS (DUF1127 family)